MPQWVSQLGVPIWVSAPDRRICHVNTEAQRLLGVVPGAALGQSCHRVIDGCAADGHPHCGPRCAMLHAVETGGELPLTSLQVSAGDGSRRWIELLCIPIHAPDGGGPWLVHCAIDRDRMHRIHGYLERVATRSTGGDGEDPRPELGKPLSPREWEILQLLADDVELPTVATRLHVSLVTVRNHVQHILTKLGVHSVLEAVALLLLGRLEGRRLPARGKPDGDADDDG